jgi:hypothetical protein
MTNDYEKQSVKKSNDAPSFGFAFLSFLFPLIGFILFRVWNNSSPQKAKSCGKGAYIGFFVDVAFGISARIGFLSYTSILLFFLVLSLLSYNMYLNYKSRKNETVIKLFSTRITKFYPLIVIFCIIWILCMLNIMIYILEFIRSGRFENNQYYAYLRKMEAADFVAFISIGALLVIAGCILLLARRKNAVFIGLSGGVIKIIGYILCGVFLKQNGSLGNNYGPIYLKDEFILYVISDLVPGLIILLLILLQKKKSIKNI